jgi:hypothetical protein
MAGMGRVAFSAAILLTPICAATLVIEQPLLAQATSTRSARSGQVSRPDIEGAWERYGMFFGPRGNAPQLPNVPPPAMPPPLKAQYRAEWQAAVQRAREADAKGQPLATGYTSCLPDGMPSMMAAMFPLEILVSKGRVTIIEEAFNQVRRILMDQPQKPLDDVEPGFFGHSVGRWDGETLVVDTIGVKENVRYQNTPHSPQMRIGERIRLVAPDILWDEITIEDPLTLERPWVVTYAYKRMKDYTLLEYVCEDNREFADEQGRQRIRIGPRKD